MEIDGVYSVGEKVLCYHGPLLYEAKCIQLEVKDGVLKYFVHYSGWNKNWDEWVTETRILKHNEENLQKQKELQEAHLTSKKSKSQKIGAKTDISEKTKKEKEVVVKKTPSEKGSPKEKQPKMIVKEDESETTAIKRKNSSDKEEDNVDKKAKTKNDMLSLESSEVQDYDTKNEKGSLDIKPNVVKKQKIPAMTRRLKLDIKISETLNKSVIDDNFLIKVWKKVLHLPARVTANDIIKEYVRLKMHVPDAGRPLASNVEFVSNGIRTYFNAVLGNRLLYRFERIQYSDMLNKFKKIPLSDIYGAIHLLRLLKNAAEYLHEDAANFSYAQLMTLQHSFQDFIKVTEKTFEEKLSLADYETASPEYHRRSI